MKYELAILTHGRSEPLAQTLTSFRENVRPLPTRIRVVGDGVADVSRLIGIVRGVFPDVEDPEANASHPIRQAGFCRSTGRLWRLAAADTDVDYVFWLEHDFLFTRSVSLEQMASLLADVHWLAQVALVRNPENDDERRAGGLIASRPAAFALQQSTVQAEGVGWRVSWLEHGEWFTTNPSLMRRSFMEGNPFLDDGKPYCEGRFGIALKQLGYRFAYWGDGVEYVKHIGVRNGSGY